jgi:FKBP-type peptidyl-prolyl cis-trans isomerase FklB
LIDGNEFDSSLARKQPAAFALKGVIGGWSEALQLMPVGSTWQLFVPPDLAYGERGSRGKIGPNATLVFEVELLSIKEKTEASEPAPQKIAKDHPAAP